MVFYRKYRPQTIEELDAEEIRQRLYAILKDGSFQALLFTGPKGLGKTSTARIVAKAINCEKRKSNGENSQLKNNLSSTIDSSGLEPCNVCEQCISITNGINLDILEIDAASNRGIDEIRDLREKVRLAPSTSLKKVYIIDEVHMLTTEAFNALLKTLEEPPAHVVFILCTTEVHKVPATILSRCQHVAFHLATQEELMRSFRRITKGEGITIDDATLALITTLAEGSFRDGAKALEELVLEANDKKISKELVEKKFHIQSSTRLVDQMIASLSKKDSKAGLMLVGQAVSQGMDMKYIVEQLINRLHEILLASFGVGNGKKDQEKILGLSEIGTLITLLSKAHKEMKNAVLAQLPLELALIEWGENEQLNNPQQVVKKGVTGSQEIVNKDQNESKKEEEIVTSSSVDTTTILPLLIEKVKQQNFATAGVLRGCSVKEYDGKTLTLVAKYKFHKDKLMEKKTRDLLETLCKEIAGSTISVLIS